MMFAKPCKRSTTYAILGMPSLGSGVISTTSTW